MAKRRKYPVGALAIADMFRLIALQVPQRGVEGEVKKYTKIKGGRVYLVVGMQSFQLAYEPCGDTKAENMAALGWMRKMLDYAVLTIQKEAIARRAEG